MDLERQKRFISSKCKFYFNLNDNAKMIKTSNHHRIEKMYFNDNIIFYEYNNSMKLKDLFYQKSVLLE